MKPFLLMFGILFGLVACSTVSSLASGFDEKNTEAQIRAAICEIENGNFKSAHSILEAVLKKEPNNIYALRLLPGTAAGQIKQGDKSPENVALIKKAIAEYESVVANPILKTEREDFNRFIIELFKMIGGEEKATALLKKADNQSEEPKQRAIFYTMLAFDNYICANNISDIASVKSTVKRGGKEVYVFRKPQNPADFDRLKKCAVQGFEFIGKATTLDPESDNAWSYQARLLSQLARIAEMEGKAAEKARLMKEFDAAREKFLETSRKRIERQEKAYREKFPESAGESPKFSAADFSEEQLKELGQELKSYHIEKTLAETVDSVYFPFNTLVAPVTIAGEAPSEPAVVDDSKQKRGWKIFSPEGGFSGELPVNASVSSTTGDSRIYTASGNGLSFFILETSRSREPLGIEQDLILNTLAWTLTKYIGGRYVGEGKWNDRFESELTRKDKLNNHAARFYAYRVISCKEKTEGTMIFAASKQKNYAIDIRGAGESNELVQRFLKSLKLD